MTPDMRTVQADGGSNFVEGDAMVTSVVRCLKLLQERLYVMGTSHSHDIGRGPGECQLVRRIDGHGHRVDLTTLHTRTVLPAASNPRIST